VRQTMAGEASEMAQGGEGKPGSVGTFRNEGSLTAQTSKCSPSEGAMPSA